MNGTATVAPPHAGAANAGLEKAHRVRADRRALRAQVRAAGSPQQALGDLLEGEITEALERMPTETIVRWLPRVGRDRAARLIERAEISTPTRHLADLTSRQRLLLAHEVRGWNS